jgi:hypothetical protein
MVSGAMRKAMANSRFRSPSAFRRSVIVPAGISLTSSWSAKSSLASESFVRDIALQCGQTIAGMSSTSMVYAVPSCLSSVL